MFGNATAIGCFLIPKKRKKLRILGQIQALPKDIALLAQDETDLQLFPSLRAGWGPRGQAASVQITGYNARRTLFGAMNLRTGHLLCLDQDRKREEDFLEFLDFLRTHYRSGPLALLLDGNSIHTSEASLSLAEDLDIQFLWLPQRSPHLNPMDRLWGHGKEAVCSNYQQDSIDDQVIYFIDYYQSMSATERLRRSGIYSPDYWLYDV